VNSVNVFHRACIDSAIRATMAQSRTLRTAFSWWDGQRITSAVKFGWRTEGLVAGHAACQEASPFHLIIAQRRDASIPGNAASCDIAAVSSLPNSASDSARYPSFS
jgi:hypothetical protein